jgi:hypothetical protein
MGQKNVAPISVFIFISLPWRRDFQVQILTFLTGYTLILLLPQLALGTRKLLFLEKKSGSSVLFMKRFTISRWTSLT